MAAIDKLKALLQSPPPPMPDLGEFIYVYLPQDIEPDERYDRYQEPLDAELRLYGAGWVSGGGSLMGDELEDGTDECLHVGVDVDVVVMVAASTVEENVLRLQERKRGVASGAFGAVRTKEDIRRLHLEDLRVLMQES